MAGDAFARSVLGNGNAMQLVKKILIAHGDARVKRKLVLALADAGYDQRAFIKEAPALESAKVEWFDLAVIDAQLARADDFAFVTALKRAQPTLPIILIVPEVELPLLVRGLRMGLADVLPTSDDLVPLLQRIHKQLRPGDAPKDQGLTAADIAEVEALLGRLGEHSPVFSTTEPTDNVQAMKERALLEAKVERLAHEKTALEAQLKLLSDQKAEAERLAAEASELQAQREVIAATQAAIDEKARGLADVRASIARERATLEEERRRSAAAAPKHDRTEAELASEREALAAEHARLLEEEARQRSEALALRQEAAQIAIERRRWHDDLDLLREQENNLREYETRLRQLQVQLEADRVSWSSRTKPSTTSPFEDPSIRAGWEKIQRASELIEAERATFRDERLALRDYDTALKLREEKVARREEQLAEFERMRLSLPPVGKPAAAVAGADAGEETTFVKTLSRAPFNAAKAIWTRGK